MAPSSYSYVRLLSLRMVIMAGMLPGVEFARRRRRASSLCLHAPSSKEWSSACMETTARAWTTLGLGSGAREAKERLDQKLRAQRQPVVLKRHEVSTSPTPAKAHDDATCSGGLHRHHSAACSSDTGVLLRREVVSSPKPNKKGGGGGGRFGWCRRLAGGRRGPPAAAEAGCAVCLEELRAGDVVARLPCAHRFHWSCAVPWVQAASRCPVCRAHARV